MKLRNALLVASMLAAPAAAFAQPVLGPYVSLGVGANYLQDETLRNVSYPQLGFGYGRGFGGGNQGNITSDTGIMGSGAFGWGFGNGFRIELQGDYRENSLKSFSGLSANGNSEQFGGFVNVLYDFNLAPFGLPQLSPYIGVGGGYEDQHFQSGSASGFGGVPAVPVYYRLTGSEGSAAVQGILGLAYNIDAIPGLAVTAEYRFMTMPENLGFHGQYFQPGLATRVNYHTDGTYNHAGLIGLRYALFSPPAPPTPAPPPPAPAAPPVAQARTYLVFFDWDRADLTDRARQIVAEAAQASTHVQTTKIDVNGYTDLSGTAAYNQKLSVRRAQTVEAELVRDGVPQGEIAIQGFGESNPLVPTAAGVREPQNRRVEIILH